tara:strand:- start:110 stop:403 length:294 start_codon:yes stop_codon:yes gene_type:complete
MSLSEFTLSERGLSDLNIISRELWSLISPAANESWTSITQELKDKRSASLTSADVATSFSEAAISQLAISDLAILVTRENWDDILATTNTESWNDIF